MRHGWLMAVALALVSLNAMAVGTGAVRKQVEASMAITGAIEVAEDGSVRSYEIDRGDELPKDILDFVRKNVDNWKFEPVFVDGKPKAIRNKMALLAVAKKLDGDRYAIRLQAASFDPFEIEKGSEIASKTTLTPPAFPIEAAKKGVGGTVYLVLKIGGDGKVQDAITEQVNLHVVENETKMERYRRLLSEAALRAAMKWEFDPPTSGEYAADPFWLARVPVEFRFPGLSRHEYGQWQTYVPGPRQRHPWAENEDPGYSPEALAAGGVHMVGKGGLRLLTPLGVES